MDASLRRGRAPSAVAEIGRSPGHNRGQYRPGDAKVAVFSADPGSSVEVRRASDDTVVYTVPGDGGAITFKGPDGMPSGDTVWWVDFSGFATDGTYRLFSTLLGAQSYDFEIRDDIYNLAVLAGLKTYYYQRCNVAKQAAHAGDWATPPRVIPET